MRWRPFATVLAGPCALLREGLTRILGEADFRIVASTRCIDDLVLRALPQHPSILLIIDAGYDLDAAVAQIGLFKRRHPAGRVAVLADDDQPSGIVSAFRAGANAYFIKIAPCDAVIKSLELVMLGETILPAAILSMILERADDDAHDHQRAGVAREIRKPTGEVLIAEGNDMPRLSIRERCILNCLIEGDSNKVIARKVEIAEATVKVHIKAILRKIRVHNRTQAAIWAMNNGSLLWAMDNGCSSAAAKVPVEPSLKPGVVEVLSEEQTVASTLQPADIKQIEGPDHVGLPGNGRLARKRNNGVSNRLARVSKGVRTGF